MQLFECFEVREARIADFGAPEVERSQLGECFELRQSRGLSVNSHQIGQDKLCHVIC